MSNIISALYRVGKGRFEAWAAMQLKGVGDTMQQVNSKWATPIFSTDPDSGAISNSLTIYESVSSVYIAVQAIVTAAKNGVPKIYNASNEDISDREEFKVIYDPNPIQTYQEFTEGTLTYLLLPGEAYWFMIKNQREQVIETILLNSKDVHIEVDNKGYIEGYKVYIGGKFVILSHNEVFFIKRFNPKSIIFKGLSPLSSVLGDSNLDRYAQAFSQSFFAHGGRPSGAVTTEQTIDKEGYAREKARLRTEYGGIDNAYKIMLLDRGLKYNQLSLSPQEADYLESRKYSARNIAAAYGVPPIFMNDFERANYANALIQERTLYQNRIIPLMADLAAIYTKFLLPMLTNEKGVRLEYDFSSVSALSQLANKITNFKEGVNIGAITRNEMRTEVYGLPESDEPLMNSFLVPFNLISIGDTASPEERQESVDRQTAGIIQKSRESQSIVAYQRFRVSRENKLEEKSKEFFSRQEKAVIEKLIAAEAANRSLNGSIDKQVTTEQIFNVGQWINEYAEIYAPWYSTALVESANMTLNIWALSGEINITDPAIIGALNQAGNKIQEIQWTTQTDIRNTLVEGVTAGEDIAQLTSRIEHVFDVAKTSRARMIAITETTKAQNAGIQNAFVVAGVKAKVWLSMRDTEVREAHMSADGQTVNTADYYYVGGESLIQPGMGSIAANNINCRCLSIPKVDD